MAVHQNNECRQFLFDDAGGDAGGAAWCLGGVNRSFMVSVVDEACPTSSAIHVSAYDEAA